MGCSLVGFTAVLIVAEVDVVEEIVEYRTGISRLKDQKINRDRENKTLKKMIAEAEEKWDAPFQM